MFSDSIEHSFVSSPRLSEKNNHNKKGYCYLSKLSSSKQKNNELNRTVSILQQQIIKKVQLKEKLKYSHLP
jgi:ribosomal protein S6